MSGEQAGTQSTAGVLPEGYWDDPERVARYEAKMLRRRENWEAFQYHSKEGGRRSNILIAARGLYYQTDSGVPKLGLFTPTEGEPFLGFSEGLEDNSGSRLALAINNVKVRDPETQEVTLYDINSLQSITSVQPQEPVPA